MKQSVVRRQYTQSFKVEAARLGESIGAVEAAKRLGVPESSLWNWIVKARTGAFTSDADALPRKRGQSELERENERLRRELANAQADLEIVKKAAAYFAKESR